MKTSSGWFVVITLILAASPAPANIDRPVCERLEKSVLEPAHPMAHRNFLVKVARAAVSGPEADRLQCAVAASPMKYLARELEYHFELAPGANPRRIRAC